jgi:CheY-like chemotaxis protein
VIRAVLFSTTDLEADLRETLLWRRNVERVSVSSVEEVLGILLHGRTDVLIVDSVHPEAAEVTAILRRDPVTRGTPVVALGRSDFGFAHIDLLQAGVNAILPLPPAADWDDRLMRLIHVPARRVTRFKVDLVLEGGRQGGEGFSARALNLSVHGLLLESRLPLEIGEDVRLSFELPGTLGAVRGTGTVVRMPSPDCYGVELTSVEEDGRVRIKRFVESTPP